MCKKCCCTILSGNIIWKIEKKFLSYFFGVVSRGIEETWRRSRALALSPYFKPGQPGGTAVPSLAAGAGANLSPGFVVTALVSQVAAGIPSTALLWFLKEDRAAPFTL